MKYVKYCRFLNVNIQYIEHFLFCLIFFTILYLSNYLCLYIVVSGCRAAQEIVVNIIH